MNVFKPPIDSKKADGTAIGVTTRETAIKNALGKSFAVTIDFNLFKHSVYPYRLKENLIVRLD